MDDSRFERQRLEADDVDKVPDVRGEPPAEADEPASRRRIVFIINSLAGGGAERSLCNFLSFAGDELSEFEVHLILLDREAQHHRVDARVRMVTLDAKGRYFRSMVHCAEMLRRIKPCLTISFLTRANCVNAILSPIFGCPSILSERVHTTRHFGSGMSAVALKLLVRVCYSRAKAVIAVSSGVADDLVGNFRIPKERVCVIENGIDIATIHAKSREASPVVLPNDYIVGAGRLVANKNFVLLIRAYHLSKIQSALVILGEGPERESLCNLVRELGLTQRVFMPGYLPNPYPIIRNAKFFVSSSNAEGFPNVLVEAMALSCPVISTDCDSGPAEILGGKFGSNETLQRTEYGVLTPVDKIEPLADAMVLMTQSDVRDAYALKGFERAAQFTPMRMVQKYMDVVRDTLRI
jgi:N-acetylgalactosamine-N,N'-diacetylbacillosaminyl-diphospho-undecaprenol 4-alpha-N-acetylgalactosaminyltransferase